MSNKPECEIEKFVTERKKIHQNLEHINEFMGLWSEYIWGKKPYRYRFLKKQPKISDERSLIKHSEKNLKPTNFIGEYYLNFLKSYLSYICIEEGRHSNYLMGISAAFCDLTSCLEPNNIKLSELTQVEVNEFMSYISKKYSEGTTEAKGAFMCNLISFLEKNGMLNHKLHTKNPFKYINSSQQVLRNREKKLPSMKVINAIAEIYNLEMPKDGQKNISMTKDVCFRSACAATSLLFVAPSRISELSLLTTSPVEEIYSDSGISYCLKWRGSKGMPDHDKHLHKDMVATVNRSISYLKKIGEPARILSRFYENQKLPLKELLGSYKIRKPHRILLNSPVTLWQLGGLLGFYDTNELKRIKLLKRNFKTTINLPENIDSTITTFGDLCPHFPYDVDQNTIITSQLAKDLFGSPTPTFLPFFEKYTCMTLRELASEWIDYLKSNIIGFPYRYIGSEGKRVKLNQALFIQNGAQLHPKNPAYKFSNSKFAIRSTVDQLSGVWTPITKRSLHLNLFYRHGYDPNEYKFTSHQARHFLNTLAQRSSISDEIIALWSGRSSTSQNKVYNHVTDEEIDAKILSIGVVDDRKTIIPITAEDFSDLTGKEFASKTSTGFCIQSLYVNPCTYLQVGLSGCSGCKSHCYIKGDVTALEILETDLALQVKRLDDDRMGQRVVNPIMKKWFNTHVSNIEFLTTIIKLLQRDDIVSGAIVRYTGTDEFKVTIDGMTKAYKVVFELPATVKEMIQSNGEQLKLPKNRANKSKFDILIESIYQSNNQEKIQD